MTKLNALMTLAIYPLIAWGVAVEAAWGDVAKRSYSLSSTPEQPSIIVDFYAEEIDKSITTRSYQGNATPVAALETFFYLGEAGVTQDIVDLHYPDDGTRRYISEMLFRSPDSFAGAVNLRELSIDNVLYWGDHRVVNFTMRDANSTLPWWEDFICKTACYKSNYLNIFGESAKRNLFVYVLSAAKQPVDKIRADEYQQITLQAADAATDYPLTLRLRLQKVTEATQQSHWYKLLIPVQNTSFDFLDEYVPTIFSNWDENDTVAFQFKSTAIDKSFLVGRLSSADNFRVESYLEEGDKIWIWASASLPFDIDSDNITVSYLFLYDKVNQLFDMDIPLAGPYGNIDGIIRNSITKYLGIDTTEVLDRDKETSTEIYQSRLSDAVIDEFYQGLKVDERVKAAAQHKPDLFFIIFLTLMGIAGPIMLFVIFRIMWRVHFARYFTKSTTRRRP